MELRLELGPNSYDIIIERGSIKKLNNLLDLQRKVAIISDDLIPEEYINTALKQCKEGYVIRFPHGEENKTIETYKTITEKLVELQFSRNDVVLALGGGVTSDLAGYVAATYMRGIDFYIVPTTLLSQVDASIGGKVAVNLDGIKNLVGAFYQPKKVVIDPDTLKTLPERLFNEGLAESIKMAATCDKELFSRIENSQDIHSDIDEIIYRSLLIKKRVVEEDEKETGLRRVLNFGHTYGHAIESVCKGSYYHGECVGMGMLYTSSGEAQARIKALLEKYHLPTHYDVSEEELLKVIKHDKKANANKVTLVKAKEIGSFEFDTLNL